MDPRISAGIGNSYLNGNGAWDDNTNKRSMASSMACITWNHSFLESNALVYSVGQPQFLYGVEDGFVADGDPAMELWYSFQVSDNIQVTPAIYWLSFPWGDDIQNVLATASLSASSVAGFKHLLSSDFSARLRLGLQTNVLTHTPSHTLSTPMWRVFLWLLCFKPIGKRKPRT